MDTGSTITISIVGFFVLLALLVFLRLLYRKSDPLWREIRVGFFIERVTAEDDSLPPTTLIRPEK